MTVLGKILVIVNLVFSLVVGALIIIVFLTRTNWKAGFEKMEAEYKVANANAETYRQEVEQARQQTKAVQENYEVTITKLKDEQATAEKQLKEYKDALAVAKTSSQVSSATTDSATEEAKRRKAETDNLQTLIQEKEKKILALAADAKKAQDEAIKFRLANDSLQDRNKSLLDLNETLAKEVEKNKTMPGGVGPAVSASAAPTKPPPEDVQGKVLDSDPSTGLVTVSIGSDSGVLKGHTLEVFRMSPKPEYVGMIRIVDSRYHEAVGRAIQPLRTGAGPIRKDDMVASKIQAH